MMNKAQKRLIEVQALADVHRVVDRLKDSTTYDAEYYKQRKKEDLEENSGADTTYYDNNIEEAQIKLEIIGKVSEIIYKLM